MVDTDVGKVRRGMSREADPVAAVDELFEAVGTGNELVMFFCSPAYDRDILGRAIADRFAGQRVLGCTTAGEITPEGYAEKSLTGFGLPADDFTAVTHVVDALDAFTIHDGLRVSGTLVSELKHLCPDTSLDSTFGLLLVDGLSLREEGLVSAIYRGSGAGAVSIVGGSAGDGLDFRDTWVYSDGQFRSNAAAICFIATERPFRVFKTAHFETSERRIVVTEANPAKRIVTEIDGAPAAEEYARLLGYDPGSLTPMIFSNHPVALQIGGNIFVRSIQQVNDDGSLSFYCAIDEGVVLRIATATDLIADLTTLFRGIEAEIGEPDLIIGFDCILRNLELTDTGRLVQAGALMAAHNVVGFSTYGEQYSAMHVNQTFTGVAIGASR